MNNKKTLKLIRNVLIIGIIILIFLYFISVYYLNDIGLVTCFIFVIIIISIISYLNRKIFRLEHLEEVELERKMEENACKIRCFKCGVKLTYNDITCSNCGSNNIYYNKAIIESIDF